MAKQKVKSVPPYGDQAPRAPRGPSGIGLPKGPPKLPPGPKFSRRQGKRGA